MSLCAFYPQTLAPSQFQMVQEGATLGCLQFSSSFLLKSANGSSCLYPSPTPPGYIKKAEQCIVLGISGSVLKATELRVKPTSQHLLAATSQVSTVS